MKRDSSYLIGNKFAKGNKPNRTSFKKGHKPWNRDKKGIHLSPSTEFKKGRKSSRTVPTGTITIRTDKGGHKRKWIKVSMPNIWIEYAKFVWISNNGLIARGILIHHIDENTLNDKISNLAAVSKKAHFEIHRIGEIGRAAKAKKRRLKEI